MPRGALFSAIPRQAEPCLRLTLPYHVLSTCQESQWHCGGDGARCEELVPGCADGEAPCRDSGHCVPYEWLCDNQDDCGDGSDEEGECPRLCVAMTDRLSAYQDRRGVQ